MQRLLDEHLEKLKTRVLKMCSLVDEQVQFAIKAVEDDNLELAQSVIDRDKKVNKYDVKIDKICQKIFALAQPVAMDLRYIMSSLTINSNLERIGDIAVNIAENIILIKKKPEFYANTKLEEMFNLTKHMLKNSIDAFIGSNPVLAKEVILADDIIDKLNGENYQILKSIMKQNPDNIEGAVALLVISRELERLADHSTNIAEDVFFIVEAQMIKHKYEKYIFGDDDNDSEDDKVETES
ncbi:MAG: phosphate signaling complex protein PhoU [Ignavibacteriaceae bacterium]|nr:phosphate signaling complex protein PhoU [Ignavibacterium sp.]MCC6255787.1 phosphate signaling complex protein PhoU [Ignavibacteriaceae bacterium]HRN26512.1 phosphate signaling complex protein PhoU [Ignavibacteriaceae bacterium]HRQ55372.1 phosphate signaling complex protein PhoU [Ignavibacteriaceae bacterium]